MYVRRPIHLLYNKPIRIKNNILPIHTTCSMQEGCTPLLLACRLGNVETAKLLIAAQADINATDALQRTPLMYACENGLSDVAFSLVSRRALVNSQDHEGVCSACNNRVGIEHECRGGRNSTPTHPPLFKRTTPKLAYCCGGCVASSAVQLLHSPLFQLTRMLCCAFWMRSASGCSAKEFAVRNAHQACVDVLPKTANNGTLGEDALQGARVFPHVHTHTRARAHTYTHTHTRARSLSRSLLVLSGFVHGLNEFEKSKIVLLRGRRHSPEKASF